MGFIDPMTAGDVTIRLQMDKNVSSNNNITIDAHIGLPDLKIGQYSLQKHNHNMNIHSIETLYLLG